MYDQSFNHGPHDQAFPISTAFHPLLSLYDHQFLTLLTPLTFTSALSFNFTSFSNDNTDITYEIAYSENQAIKLTGSNLTEQLQGRATYSKPL